MNCDGTPVLAELLRNKHSFGELSSQDGACTDARQAQRPRGYARGDGAHPHSHPGCCTACPCAVETETFKVIQCKKPK